MTPSTTVRLYYTDSYQTTFDASIVNVQRSDGKQTVLLDQTAFYPTSGGQAHDTGHLAGMRVIDVIEGADGSVLHVLDGDADLAVGDRVRGEVDWPRRYEHMQQHAGQHLLSHVFHAQLGLETVSVHFGAAESTLDLRIDALAPAQIQAVERRANELVYANLSLKAYFVDDETVRTLPLRRPPQVQGQIRIVEMDALDWVACGGTHCRRTGELGPIKLVRQERSRGNVRVTFLCGWRALADYAAKHRLATDLASRFSTEAAAVPASIERQQEEARQLQREVVDLRERLQKFQLTELLKGAQSLGEYTVIADRIADETSDSVKQLVQQLQREPQLVVVLGCEAGGTFTVFAARGENVPLNVGQLLRASLQKFEGRGGGRPEFAQGGGLAATDIERFLAHIREQIGAELP